MFSGKAPLAGKAIDAMQPNASCADNLLRYIRRSAPDTEMAQRKEHQQTSR